MNFSQSTDWLFLCRKSHCVRGIYNFAQFSKYLPGLRSLGEGVSNSLFDGGQKGVLLLLTKSHNSLTFTAIKIPSIKAVFSLGWWGIFRYFATSDKSLQNSIFFTSAT